MTQPDRTALFNEAAEIAANYNWNAFKEGEPSFPDVVEQLRKGTIPEGFPREVGKTIALLLERPVIGWGFFGLTQVEAEQEDTNCRQHANRLARLRLLLAQLRQKEKHF